MQIPLTLSATTTRSAPSSAEPREVKPEAERTADIYNASRACGNYFAGVTLGALTETVASTAQAPRLAWEIAENLWQAETLGPNIKTLGTLAALPGAALSVAIAPLYGAVKGVMRVADQRRDGEGPLRIDSAIGFARDITSAATDGEPRTMSGMFIEKLEALGARTLEPGAKPYDVPLLSPLFAVAGGAASGVIGGAVGLVAGLAAGVISGCKDMAEAVTSAELDLGARIGKVLTAPLNLVVGPALAWKSIKESVPRGLSDGWRHGPLKPVADTARISTALGLSVIKEAWER